MIDLLLDQAADPAREPAFLRDIAAHIAAVEASARAKDRRQVARAEAAVRADPQTAFGFDATGNATLHAGTTSLAAGHFATPSIAELRSRAAQAHTSTTSGRVRLWILDGASPATDIGSLQAGAPPGTLFQVASQFNCLEAPGAQIVPVADYFGDPTQGPRASISAYSGTLLRHYAAPDGHGGRFVQTSDGPQINLLDAVCAPGVATVRSGYLTARNIADRATFIAALERDFESLRVGVHDDLPVLLGYNWDGAVAGEPRIGQVFTSTFAGGGYSGVRPDDPRYLPICTALLRAAYLGTLLAAAVLGRHHVVLTLIGGGVFGNLIPLIWEAIRWAASEVEPLLGNDMNVIVNGRNLGEHLRIADLMPAVRASGGAALVFGGPEAKIVR